MNPLVIVAQTGGTIASEQNKKAELEGLSPTSIGEGITKIGNTEVELYSIFERPKDSSKLLDIDIISIGNFTAKKLREGQRIVITHGTDRMQDSACTLNYNLVYVPTRVVFTGALYPRGSAKYDGDKNLKDSVVFAENGNQFSGVFIVMGGHILYPEFWGKHLYRFHDPVIQHYQRAFEERERKSRPGARSLIGALFKEEPYDSFGTVIGPLIKKEKHQTPYVETDGHFTVERGGEGKVRELDRRGSVPVKGEEIGNLYSFVYRGKRMAQVYKFLKEYGKLKNEVLKDKETFDSVTSRLSELTKKMNYNGDKLIKTWGDLIPFFDERCYLDKTYVIGDAAGDLSIFIDKIREKSSVRPQGFVVRGWGYGHANTDDPNTQKFLTACKEENIPVAITTSEGIIVSDEYEVARALIYTHGGIPFGTLSDKEAQVRLASVVGHADKIKFINTVARNFEKTPLEIIRGYCCNGLLYKTLDQRLRYEKYFGVPTNLDLAASPSLTFEEKILLTAIGMAYLSPQK